MAFTPSAPGNGNTAALPHLTAGSPGAAGGQIANQKVVRTLYDYDPNAILRSVFRRNSKWQSDFMLMLRAMGMSRGVSAPTTGHYERGWVTNLCHIGSVGTAATGAGDDAILVLGANSMYNASQTASGAAVQMSEVRVNDVLQFNGGVKAMVTAKNTSVSPHEITVMPLKAADTLVGNVTAGASYAILYNAHGEGSDLPHGKIPRLLKYTNDFTIVKEAVGATGSALSDTLFPQWEEGQDGTIFVGLNMEAVENFERSKGHTILFGETIDNVVQFNAELGIDIPVRGTEGAIDFVTAYGHIPQYAGAYTLAGFDVLAEILTYESIGTNTMVNLLGYSLYQDIENLLFNYSSTTNIAPHLEKTLALGVSGTNLLPEGFDFTVGYKAVQKGNFQFALKMLNEFNSATGAGAAAYTLANGYRTSQLVLPFGMTKDRANGASVAMFGYEWKQAGGYSRESQVGMFGGVGTQGAFSPLSALNAPVNGKDFVKGGMLAEIAGHFACPNQMIWQTKVS